jgi:hypothetical protein
MQRPGGKVAAFAMKDLTKAKLEASSVGLQAIS